ncbi:MAG: hemerythrin domain-containing protein [Acidobacteria bacterium]|nr:hemerythrin domain-containing protein [Acidobacteriota bacterium]
MEHPVEVLLDEHRLIERMLAEVETRVLNSGGKLPLDFVETALDFFAGFADGSHHHKEERVLFPMLEAAGMPVHGGPIAVMLHEHDMGRRCLAAVRNSLEAARTGSEPATSTIRAAFAEYTDLLRRHIWKEDNILFEMAKVQLSSEAQRSEMQRLFEEEAKATGLRVRYEAILNEVAGTAVY